MSLEDDNVDIDAIMADIEGDSTEISTIAEETSVAVVDEKENAVAVIDEDEIDLEEDFALANRIIKNSVDVIKKAGDVFQSFSDDVFKGKDRSTSSKEAMLKALDVQNSANKNMIDMAKVLKDKDSKGTNILINTVSEKKAGISINNIKDNL